MIRAETRSKGGVYSLVAKMGVFDPLRSTLAPKFFLRILIRRIRKTWVLVRKVVRLILELAIPNNTPIVINLIIRAIEICKNRNFLKYWDFFSKTMGLIKKIYKTHFCVENYREYTGFF